MIDNPAEMLGYLVRIVFNLIIMKKAQSLRLYGKK